MIMGLPFLMMPAAFSMLIPLKEKRNRQSLLKKHRRHNSTAKRQLREDAIPIPNIRMCKTAANT